MQLSNKLAPYGTGSGLHNWHFCQVQSHVRHTRTNINNPAGSNSDTAPYSLRISGQLSAPIANGGGHFENGRISNFEGLVTLTLDRVILHTVMHHSSTSTYMPNVIEIKETSCGRTDGRISRPKNISLESTTGTTLLYWTSHSHHIHRLSIILLSETCADTNYIHTPQISFTSRPFPR